MRHWRWFSLCGLAIGLGLLTGCWSAGYKSSEERYPNGSVKSKSRSVQSLAVNGEAAAEAVGQIGAVGAEAASRFLGIDISSLAQIALGGGIVAGNSTYHSRKRNKVRDEEYKAGVLAGAGNATAGVS